ncbi:MAG: AraC family transcriptional regulator [Oscillospiraceae bacterium]|nr:AraC family transcriptional regulator [Oscillospiraceae bacterium]
MTSEIHPLSPIQQLHIQAPPQGAETADIRLSAYRYDNLTSIYYHKHSGSYELTLITRGFGHHYYNGSISEVYKGDVFLIDADAAHSFCPLDVQNSSGLEVFNCTFRPAVFRNFSQRNPEDQALLAQLETPAFLSQLQQQKAYLGKQLSAYCQPVMLSMAALNRQLQGDRAAWRQAARAATEISLISLLGQIAAAFTFRQDKEAAGETTLSQAEKIRRYLNRHYLNANLSLTEVSQALFLSQAHLCEVFRREYDCTPIQYVNRRRVLHACELLQQNGGQGAGRLYASCGYHSHNTFYIEFRKHTGYSLRDYCRAVRHQD